MTMLLKTVIEVILIHICTSIGRTPSLITYARKWALKQTIAKELSVCLFRRFKEKKKTIIRKNMKQRDGPSQKTIIEVKSVAARIIAVANTAPFCAQSSLAVRL